MNASCNGIYHKWPAYVVKIQARHPKSLYRDRCWDNIFVHAWRPRKDGINHRWVVVSTFFILEIWHTLSILSYWYSTKILVELGKLKTHSPIYWIKDNWEKCLNVRHTLGIIYLTSVFYIFAAWFIKCHYYQWIMSNLVQISTHTFSDDLPQISDKCVVHLTQATHGNIHTSCLTSSANTMCSDSPMNK